MRASRANRTTSRLVGLRIAVPDASASGWQAYCFAYGMSDHAYDISYLLDLDTIKDEPRELRIVRTPPPARAAVEAQPKRISVAEAQEAMARELMEAAAFHEALIEQYLRISAQATTESTMH